MTFTGHSETKEYTGSTITINTVDVSETTAEAGLVEGDTHNVEFSASGIEAGEYPGTITGEEAVEIKSGEKDVTANYDITVENGQLTITQTETELTVELAGKEYVYDGESHSLPAAATTNAASGTTTIEYSKDGETWTADLSSLTATEVADSCTIQVRATNPNYKNTATGSAALTITKRTVVMTSATDSKTYDGTPLTNDEVTVTGDGFAEGEGANFDVTGSQTLVGSSENTFTYTLHENTKAENYVIQTVFGTLTVTDGTPDEPVDPSLVVTKNDTKEDGYRYALGETVTWTITVRNIYDEDKELAVNEVEGVTLGVYPPVIKAGETVTVTASKTITEADLLKGSFTNTVTAKLGSLEKTAEDTISTADRNGHITVVKETTSETPADGYKLGDTVSYKITVTNDGNLTVTDITVEDERTGLNETIDELKPNESKEFTTETEVTEEDILSGHIINDATASGTSPDPDQPDVPVTPGHTDDEPEDKNGHLTVNKVTTSTPENGEAYQLGETISYRITATNDGNLTLTDVIVRDELTGDEWTIAALAPNESKEFTTEYRVTEADILNGEVLNVATAEGTSPDPDEPEVPVVPGRDPEPTEEVRPVLEVTKTADKETFKYGDTVTYTIVVRNTGNVTVKDITVTDELTGGVTPAEPFTLAPNESKTLTAAYTVKASDVTAKTVKNIAAAAGTDPLDKPVEGSGEATVRTEAVKITIKAADDEKVYDGEPLTNDTYEQTEGTLNAGDRIDSVTVTGSQTLVGTSDNIPGEVKIVNAAGEDVTEGYDIKLDNGTLTVTDGTPDEPVDPALVVTKTAEDKTYKLDETVTFTVTAKNIYAEAKTITLSEIDGVTLEQSVFENVEPGATVTTTATYTIKEADVLNGNFKNTVTAVIDELEKTAEATVDTEEKNGHLTVNKITTSTPANGAAYALGETIEYEITVKNDGNLTITDITVSDELTNENWMIASLAPGASETFTTSYVVTEEDILNGEVLNVATAKGTSPDPDKPEVPVTPGEDPEPTEDKNGHLTVEKITTSEPANGEAYALGETITYKITAKNDGNLTITDVTVTDELTNDSWTIASLAPGASEEFETSYTVKEADILKGTVLNVATAKGTSPDPDKPEVPVTPGEDPEPTEDKNGHLTVEKVTTSTPANGETYALGEEITYKITAKNDGNMTITDVTVSDELTGDEWTIASLAPGASEEFETSYTVTEKDILNGTVLNVATAKGTSPDPDKPEVPVTPGEDPEPTEDKNGHLTVEKVTTSTPANGETYALGEEITYKITAKNDGNMTITDVTVSDELTGDEWTIASLAPGASEEFETSYTVTEKDILNGTVLNVATAKGTSPDPDKPEVPVTPGEDPEPTEDIQGSLAVTKTTTSTAAEEGRYTLDEEITYRITVENTGNVTLTNVKVTDELTGDEWTIESLGVGETKEFDAKYTVAAEDVVAGKVTNTVTVKGTSPDPEKPEASGEASVTDETRKAPGNDVTPEPTPEDEGAKMDAESQSIIVVYDGNEHTVTAKADKEGSTIYYSTDGGVTWSEEAPKRTDVGTTEFAVKATHPVYEDVIRTGYKLVVLPAEAVIIVDSYTKVYGDADPEWTATVTGLIGDDTLDYELYRDSGENVGVYYIHVGFVGESTEEIKGISWEAETGISEVTYNKQIGNYNVKVVEGTLTIVPRNVTVTANDAEKKVGESDPEFTVIIEGLLEGDTVEYVIARDPGEEAGTYTIRVTGETDQGNFTVTFVNGTLTIRPEEKIVPTPEPKPAAPSTGDDSGKWNGTFGFSLIALILAALLRKRYGDEA